MSWRMSSSPASPILLHRSNSMMVDKNRDAARAFSIDEIMTPQGLPFFVSSIPQVISMTDSYPHHESRTVQDEGATFGPSWRFDWPSNITGTIEKQANSDSGSEKHIIIRSRSSSFHSGNSTLGNCEQHLFDGGEQQIVPPKNDNKSQDRYQLRIEHRHQEAVSDESYSSLLSSLIFLSNEADSDGNKGDAAIADDENDEDASLATIDDLTDLMMMIPHVP